MEYRFQILSVNTSLKDRTITLNCSADVDEDTVTPESIYLLHRGTQRIIPMASECDRRQIILTLIQEPMANERYSLVVGNTIKSIVGDKIEPLMAMNIIFNSEVVSDVIIEEPAGFSVFKPDTAIKWKEVGQELTGAYQLQIASDVGFYNIDVDTRVAEKEFTPGALLPHQYFLRIRAVKEDDYGAWSKIVTFTIPGASPEPVPNPQPEEKPRPGIPEIIDYVAEEEEKNKKTEEEEEAVSAPVVLTDKKIVFDDEVPEAFEIAFSMPVDIAQATVKVKRREY